jgi:Coenzyme PQQ synthesis protein D (PqqD)
MNELRLRSDDLSWREIDGEIVAVDVASSAYLSSNPAGTLLWKMLAEGTTRESLATGLVDTFALDRRRAERDVETFLDNLAERGLLER